MDRHPCVTARRLSTVAATVIAMVGLAACGGGVEVREDLATDITVPDITVPDITVPDITVPSTEDPASATTAPVGPTTTGAATSDATAPPVAEDGEPQEPGDLGDDPVLDGLADDCFGGDFSACDQLFFQSDADSAYEDYGDSCGGRNEPAGLCTVIYGDG